MKNNSYLILLLLNLMILLPFIGTAQEHYYMTPVDLPDRLAYDCSLEYSSLPPENNRKHQIKSYLDGLTDGNVEYNLGHYLCHGEVGEWTAYYTSQVTGFEEGCRVWVKRTYWVIINCDGNERLFSYDENIEVVASGEEPGQVSGSLEDLEVDGWFKSDLPPAYSHISQLRSAGLVAEVPCGDIAFYHEGDVLDESYVADGQRRYVRTYRFETACTDEPLGTMQQHIYLNMTLSVSGALEPIVAEENSHDFDPVTNVNKLMDKGVTIQYDGELSDISVTYHDTDSPYSDNLRIRTYYFTAFNATDSINQVLHILKGEFSPFKASVTNMVSFEGGTDGEIVIEPPHADEGCVLCDIPNQWYYVVLKNQTTGDEREYNYENTDDIYTLSGLPAGDYSLKVYLNCESRPFSSMHPVYEESLKIYESKLSAEITPWMGLYSNHYYQSFLSTLSATGPDGKTYMYDEYDEIVSNLEDFWEPDEGLLYSDKVKEWDLYEMYNPYMNGQGAYENIQWAYNLYNSYGHGLQRFVVVKDIRGGLWYRAFANSNGQSRVAVETYKPLYKGDCLFADDPNEIYGPTGYTNADSTCVQMINATDPLSYTIQFENNPETATAAAARVKITCPLDESLEPTSFHLGNFGFGEYTFEVPQLASYYNERINLDSLGYWLDVTAAIQVPENYAYWIFQTIDPETGIAPVDSLGFLPVNDTLSGCGEGWVTFTADIKNFRSLHTGDSIVENAEIFFDENDVVPTNDYVNHLDVLAPTSFIVCDTTYASSDKYLLISFNSSDDTNGSGVNYIELYVSIDGNDYGLENRVQPDSTYVFYLNNGSSFDFFGLAVDNVNNKEDYKNYSEYRYSFGHPPYDLTLSNNVFEENDAVGTAVGFFSTFDDQNSDQFAYTFVSGTGSSDNTLFRIEDNMLYTNKDFRCYGTYQYSIRVRTTDITGLFLDKTFTIYANETETPEPVQVFEYLCPGDIYNFHGQEISHAGLYYDTIPSQLGCDSTVCLRVIMNPDPTTTLASDVTCFGMDYENNGFSISADSLAALAAGWSMNDDLILNLDNYVENAFGCDDTTRLILTVHPFYNYEDDVMVCPSDLPFVYQNHSFERDTIALFNYATALGCDSTYTLRLTLNPDYGTQSDDLSNWSWYSTYIDQSNGRGLTNLENAMGASGNLIKSKTNFVQYYPEQNMWYGTLTGIDNESMFMINTTDDVTADMTGCYADVAACPITIRHGWNWIGYPSNYTTSVTAAMSGLARVPQDGDVLKSKSSFSTYYGDYAMWFGSLGMLTPGEGYMYLSNDNIDNTLVYPSATRHQGEPVAMPETFWQANDRRFARNITFIGAIELDGNIIESDTLEVGVFCHGEQRGSGRAIYLDRLGEYRLFLTAHGEEGDELNFRLYDHEKNKERRIRSRQQVVFHDDDSYGKIDNPYLFVFNTDYDKLIEAEICDGQYYVENGFRAYRSGTYFNELPNDSIIRLDLTVNPVYHEEKSVVAFEFPFHYDDMTFDAPGTYNLQYNTAEECDSTLVLTVQPYDGVRELLISPVPAERSQRVTLFFPFTADEQHDLLVEVYTLGGNLMQTHKPKRFPIELDPFAVSGTYMVKITMGTGEVVTGKIIVK